MRVKRMECEFLLYLPIQELMRGTRILATSEPDIGIIACFE